jgi:hypothetical protein
MNRKRGTNRGVASHLLGALFLLALPGGVAPSSAVAAERSEQSASLDLAAIVLSPADLTAEGFEGYGIADGDAGTPIDVAAALAFQRDLPDDEVQALLGALGLRQAYALRLDLRPTTEDIAQSVVSTLHEYADADGAADAFAVLTDWEGIDTAETVASEAAITAASVTTRHRGTTGEPFHALDLAFRLGRITAVVRLVDFTGEEPAVADAERLATRLLERIEARLADRAAGISAQALRLAGDDVIRNWEYYSLVGGTAWWLVDTTAEDTDLYEEGMAEAGMTDEFRVGHRIVVTDTPEGDADLYTIVQRFSDEDAASAHLNGALDRLAERDQDENLEELEGLAEYGDEAVAYVQTGRWAAEDVDLVYQTYYLRVDDRLALVQLVAPRTFPLAALDELAAAQAACLEAATCAGPASLPADLAAVIGAAQRDLPGAIKETTDGTLAAEETWASPTFGAGLTYDPAEWEDWSEPVPGEDTEDTLILLDPDGQSVLTLEVLADDRGAGACVDELTWGIADEEAFGRARPIADAGGEPIAAGDAERAYAAYGVVLDDGDRTFGYFECRAFADGEAIVMIVHVGPFDRYEEQAAAREDLLDGLVLPDA